MLKGAKRLVSSSRSRRETWVSADDVEDIKSPAGIGRQPSMPFVPGSLPQDDDIVLGCFEATEPASSPPLTVHKYQSNRQSVQLRGSRSGKFILNTRSHTMWKPWLRRVRRSEAKRDTVWVLITYIHNHREHPEVLNGIVECLVEVVGRKKERQAIIEYYLFQLCNILCTLPPHTVLEKFLLSSCAKSFHFSLLMYLALSAHDHTQNSNIQRLLDLVKRTVRDRRSPLGEMDPPKDNDNVDPVAEVARKIRFASNEANDEVNEDWGRSLWSGMCWCSGRSDARVDKRTFRAEGDGEEHIPLPSFDEMNYNRMMKRLSLARLDVREVHSAKAQFDAMINFIGTLTEISNMLVQHKVARRKEILSIELATLNTAIPQGCYIPLCWSSTRHQRIVNILHDNAVVFSTKLRAPYILYVEVLTERQRCSNPMNIMRSKIKQNLLDDDDDEEIDQPASPERGSFSPLAKTPRTAHHRSVSNLTGMAKDNDNEDAESSQGFYAKAFGRLWKERKEEFRAKSQWGHMKNWDVVAVIVKAGDEMIQEQFAIQLIQQFRAIFANARLPLWLSKYRVLATKGDSGLIELITDAVSLHALRHKTPGYTTLLNYFIETYGDPGSAAFKRAQKNFIHSMAAYSLVTYFLQILDRHDGNILIDKAGHLVHIDFGFLLSDYPGIVQIETSPFKLTDDLVKVMDGPDSPAFKYYRTLCVKGFLQARKEHEKIVGLVEMMRKGPRLPCLQKDSVIPWLRDRFQLDLSTTECIEHVNGLIDTSLRNFRTKLYDFFAVMPKEN